MSDLPTTEPAPPAPVSAAPRRQLWRALAWGLAGLVLVLGLALAALAWAVHSSAGSAWLLARLPGVTVTAPKGALIGDFSAERLEIALPSASPGNRIVMAAMSWRGLTLTRAAANSATLRIAVDSLHADRVDVLITPDPNAPPMTEPQNLQLPVEVELHAVDVAELHATPLGERPVLGLRASLHLGADGGLAHRIDGLALVWDRVAVSGNVRIANVPPFDVQAQLAVQPRPGEPEPGASAPAAFDATVTARGPLAKLDLQATLRGTLLRGAAIASAPSLDLSASVLAFAAWPLGALHAETQSLDMAALFSGAPATALSGSAVLESSALDRPASVDITLSNARAGRIDEGLLPLRSLKADVRARPDDPRKIEIHALDLVLGTASEPGGRVQGSGSWTPEQATLAATLTGLAPRILDARAPAMRLSGRADLTAEHWFESAGAEPTLVLRGRIDGSLPRSGRQENLQLDLDASATSNRIDLRRATLQGGGSRATLAGRAVRQGNAEWRVEGTGTLANFDPAQWWPGAEGSGWRKGPHRLNAKLDLDWWLPAAPLTLQRMATSRGQAALRLTDSLLAGTPLTGEVTLRGEATAGLAASGALSLAATKLALRGRLAADGNDHWNVEAHAADLAAWSALLQLARPAGKAPLALGGVLDGEASVDGRWPKLTTQGHVTLKDAHAASLQLASGALRWSASTAPQAPLDVQGDIEQLALGAQKLDSLHLTIQGTAAEHRIALDAAGPVRPPQWVDALHGAASHAGEAATGTLATLRAQGALQFDPAWQQPLRWHGRLQQLDARPRGGNLPAPWLRVDEADLDAQFDPLTLTPKVIVSGGRAELASLALRWNELRWQGGAAPRLDVQAEIEPFVVAPLLARLQPDFGWGGDLVVGGRAVIHSSPNFVAQIEFGRQRGDLNVTDEAGTQAVGLTDLRVALDVQGGVWTLTQAVAGDKLGAITGTITTRTDAKALWPPANAPLRGVTELRIANLATWGAWVPAGWRLKGALHASATFGGLFGAPEYVGHIEGSGLGARNLVEGIDVHDGELDIALDGSAAKIVKMQARAGDGNVQFSGAMAFGASPEAKLRVVADHLLLFGRVDRRIVASGDAALKLDAHVVQLDGRFTIDQGLIDISLGNAPTLGSDVVVQREPVAAKADELAARTAPARDVKLNLALNLGPALRLRGRGIDTRLQGELLLTAPDGRLAASGTINAVEGTYAAYGQRLVIERGAISFSGAIDNPRLDILALRPNLDIQVGVAITGSANVPRIALFSEPDLPDNEKLSWLVLGRAPEGVPGSDTALLQAAAMALLAGEGDGPASQLLGLNPLDTVSVRQSEGAVRNTVVSVGKQLSQRWYIGYERSLTATAGNWQLIYRLGQRFTVRMQAGIDNAIDLIWSWRWD